MNDPSFAVLPLEGRTGFRLVGELDMGTVAKLETALGMVRDQRLVLDLTELSFIDSSGLHALVRHAQTLNGSGPLVLENVPPQVRRVFEIMKLDQHPALALGGG
jgi:anti-anti-sigma factor